MMNIFQQIEAGTGNFVNNSIMTMLLIQRTVDGKESTIWTRNEHIRLTGLYWIIMKS